MEKSEGISRCEITQHKVGGGGGMIVAGSTLFSWAASVQNYI